MLSYLSRFSITHPRAFKPVSCIHNTVKPLMLKHGQMLQIWRTMGFKPGFVPVPVRKLSTVSQKQEKNKLGS